MRIAIFSDAFFPQINGVVVYTVELVNYLGAHGHKVMLFVPKCNDSDIKLKLHKNVEVIKVPGIKMSFYPDFKFTNLISTKFLKFFTKKVDIINFQSPFTLGFNGLVIGKLLRIPVVGTFHTFIGSKEYMSHLPKRYKRFVNEETAWRYIRIFYNPCDLVVSPSKYTKSELIENKIKSKIDVINIGIDFVSYKKKPTKINVKKNSFVFVGRIATEKNIELLLKAFKKVNDTKKDSNLYLIGDGPQFDDVKKYVKENGLQNNVFMLGRVENTIIRETVLLSKFSAFATMSNTENQPVTLIEAMKKGLPLIGPKAKGITEMVIDNGILIEPDNIKEMANAMLKMIKDKKLQKTYSINSVRNAEQYNSKRVFANVEREYKKLI